MAKRGRRRLGYDLTMANRHMANKRRRLWWRTQLRRWAPRIDLRPFTDGYLP